MLLLFEVVVPQKVMLIDGTAPGMGILPNMGYNYRYVWHQRVWFFSSFGLFCPFWSDKGYGLCAQVMNWVCFLEEATCNSSSLGIKTKQKPCSNYCTPTMYDWFNMYFPVNLSRSLLQGPVVQKPINANPRLKINQEVYLSLPKCCSTLIFGKTLHRRKSILKNE